MRSDKFLVGFIIFIHKIQTDFYAARRLAHILQERARAKGELVADNRFFKRIFQRLALEKKHIID
jgi:hypothetical protein